MWEDSQADGYMGNRGQELKQENGGKIPATHYLTGSDNSVKGSFYVPTNV